MNAKITNGALITPARGQTLQLNLEVGAEDYAVQWASSNPNIANVDENGLVSCLKTGMATVTATASAGAASVKAAIVVRVV